MFFASRVSWRPANCAACAPLRCAAQRTATPPARSARRTSNVSVQESSQAPTRPAQRSQTGLHGSGPQQAYDQASTQAGTQVEALEECTYNEEFQNVTTMTGTLGDDPEEVTLPSSGQLAKMRLGFSNPNGSKGWMSLEAFDALAAQVMAHLRKGSCVQVTGNLRYNKWEDRETGKPRSSHILTVRSLWTVSDPPSGITATPMELWEELKTSPNKFWDNRQDKRNPRAPDFKHKESGKGLWLDSSERPSWINADGSRAA